MAPLLTLLTTLLSVSSVIAAPHAHKVLHHHKKHPFKGINATNAYGATGTGTGGCAIPLSTGVVLPSQAPVTITVVPVPESSAAAAPVAPATGTEGVAPAPSDVYGVPPQEAASPASGASPAAGASPAEEGVTPSQAASPEGEGPSSSEAASPAEGSGSTSEACVLESTITVTSTETDYVTVTAAPATAAASTSAPFGAGNTTAPVLTGSAFGTAASLSTSTATADDVSATSGGEFAEESSTSTSTSATPSSEAAVSSTTTSSLTTTSVTVAPTTSAAASAASTSASPSSSTQPATGGSSSGGSRGLAFNDASLTQDFAGSGKVGWVYNWDQKPSGSIPSGMEYVPMLWGTGGDHTGSWAASASSAISSGSGHLLSFNEPDLGAQSNLSPSDAAAGHKKYMNPFSGQAQIGSPAVTNGGGSSGLAWLQSFFDSCDGGCKVDFICIHWYDSATNIGYFKSHVTDAITLAKKNGVDKVWITEFQGSGSSDQQISFLNEVQPWLESQPEVTNWAWFMCADGNLVNGNSMSPLGQAYAS